MSETKLLPCPFCGGKAAMGFDDAGAPEVYCTGLHRAETEEEAVENWNRRAVLPSHGVRVRALEWEDTNSAEDGFFGRYDLDKRDDGKWDALLRGSRVVGGRRRDTRDEAMAAAQADYERRILAALEFIPSPAA